MASSTGEEFTETLSVTEQIKLNDYLEYMVYNRMKTPLLYV